MNFTKQTPCLKAIEAVFGEVFSKKIKKYFIKKFSVLKLVIMCV